MSINRRMYTCPNSKMTNSQIQKAAFKEENLLTITPKTIERDHQIHNESFHFK
jgi:hypothetical protein